MSAQPNHRLAVSVIDGCSVGAADGRVIGIKSRKARALIGVLAVSPGMALPRDKLAGLLWSEFDQENARASLRQCVKIIRQELGPGLAGLLNSDREILSLDRAEVSSDYESLMESADEGRHGDPVFQGEEVHDRLFSGFEGIDEAFAVWLAVFRETARRHLQASMEAAIRLTAADSSTTGNFAISNAVHLPNLSYSIWIKPEPKLTSNRRILHRSSLFTTVGTLYSLYLTPEGKLVFEVNSATAVETVDAAITDGVVYHIAVTRVTAM